MSEEYKTGGHNTLGPPVWDSGCSLPYIRFLFVKKMTEFCSVAFLECPDPI